MVMTVFETRIGGEPRAAAELAELRWISGHERDVRLAPAVVGVRLVARRGGNKGGEQVLPQAGTAGGSRGGSDTKITNYGWSAQWCGRAESTKGSRKIL